MYQTQVPVEGARPVSHLQHLAAQCQAKWLRCRVDSLHVFSRLPLRTVQFLMIERGVYGSEPSGRVDMTRTPSQHLPTTLHMRDGNSAVLYPRMRHLKLDRVAFLAVSPADSTEVEEETEESWQHGRWYEAFVAALRARVNLAKPGMKLIITGTDAITGPRAEASGIVRVELENYVDDVIDPGRPRRTSENG
ncbi:uncharacterized protein PHACADRAFT_162310 [Phanerochaete carnosa HHB-10118-sp]|uniref:Uncharacterized protein n=1 Tax=Phanerochaete carnosa (strain HHB-10118-sp) TaxID=650164 RepID=K5VR40_PHACS|nr:uncharacterized protein PHACADRAFT_162310 [Phanerochaete carnosa HHB-10118-sp]EKM53928.1 hypothetical protein PHACADRAFT_162310 [Phanerochaete carnosa HHB-10118-sp]